MRVALGKHIAALSLATAPHAADVALEAGPGAVGERRAVAVAQGALLVPAHATYGAILDRIRMYRKYTCIDILALIYQKHIETLTTCELNAFLSAFIMVLEVAVNKT